MKHLAIIGGGSWGTALAVVLAPRFPESGCGCTSGPGRAHARLRENDIYLPGFPLPCQRHCH